MTRKACAYCGRSDTNLEREHAIPSSLYPASKAESKVQRLIVPACRECNASWSDDESHFRNVLTVAGPPNQSLKELWKSKVLRSFSKTDGRRRFSDLWDQLRSVQTPSGERHKIFPATDERFHRVLRKIVRALHFHHDLWAPMPDDMVGTDVLRFVVPAEFLKAMPVYHRDRDIFEYQFERFDAFDDIPLSTAWLLTFFQNRRFVAWVR